MPLCSRGSVAAIPANRSPGRVGAVAVEDPECGGRVAPVDPRQHRGEVRPVERGGVQRGGEERFGALGPVVTASRRRRVAPRCRVAPRPRGSGPRAARRPTCDSSPPATSARVARREACRRCRSGRRAGTVRPSPAPARWPAARRAWWTSTPPRRRAEHGGDHDRRRLARPGRSEHEHGLFGTRPRRTDRSRTQVHTALVQHRQWRESSPTPRPRVRFRRRRAWRGLRPQAWRSSRSDVDKNASRRETLAARRRVHTVSGRKLGTPCRTRSVPGIPSSENGSVVSSTPRRVSTCRFLSGTIRPICGPSVTVTSRRSSPSSSMVGVDDDDVVHYRRAAAAWPKILANTALSRP